MTEQKKLMHEDARKRYLIERRAPATETFQHFENDAQRQAHLAEVREKQEAGIIPF